MRRWWQWALGAVLLAVALRYATRFPWAHTWAALATADWVLLAVACAANLLSLAAKAACWQLLLRAHRPVRVRTTQAATFAGAAVGSFSVAVSGEAMRLHLLASRDGVAPADGVRSIVASRLVEAAALGIGLGVFAAVPSGISPWRVAAAGIGLTAAALALLGRLPWIRLRQPDGSAPQGWTPSGLVAPLGFAMAGWALQWATYHWSIAAMHIAVTPSASMLALLLANVGGALRLTPGNVGVVQGAVLVALRPSGVRASTAIAAGLALQAVQVLPVAAIGTVILGRRGLRMVRRRAPELEPTS
ncbi:MAG TPA: lysylphosphatidylglycerol synthase transmembrane domain-containing protein [Gemmatimonadales bacterium]|nr:lysylphosphatidylglycerol synthase transmembrane domain-containing protein [Gemmatimonadales bacterium]